MFEVCEQKCDQCLFTPQRIVSKAQMTQILKECRQQDTYFQCHKGTIAGKDICCRGFYDTQTSQLMRIAQRLDAVRFVEPPTATEQTKGQEQTK